MPHHSQKGRCHQSHQSAQWAGMLTFLQDKNWAYLTQFLSVSHCFWWDLPLLMSSIGWYIFPILFLTFLCVHFLNQPMKWCLGKLTKIYWPNMGCGSIWVSTWKGGCLGKYFPCLIILPEQYWWEGVAGDPLQITPDHQKKLPTIWGMAHQMRISNVPHLAGLITGGEQLLQ